MNSGLLLNIIVTDCSAVFEALSSEDQSLLISWDAFLLLDFGFHCFDCVTVLYIDSDGSASECLNEDLHWLLYLVESSLVFNY